MPNPDDDERDGRDVSISMSEDDNHRKDPDSDAKDEDTAMADLNQTSDGAPGGEVKKKYDPKDPHRPRRKKARRACYACQRAHLTCGKISSLPSVLPSTAPAILATASLLLVGELLHVPAESRQGTEPVMSFVTRSPPVTLCSEIRSPTRDYTVRLVLDRRSDFMFRR